MALWSVFEIRGRLYLLILAALASFYHFSFYEPDELHQVYRKVRLGHKAVFVETAVQTSIDGPFDIQPIKDLCSSKNWTEGLITACGTPQGGVGNVRNVLLNCVRYAIEAGGAFVVPQMIARSDSDLRAITTNHIAEFSHLFDLEHFLASMRESCPQMRIYSHLNDLYNLPSTATPLLLTPQRLTQEFIYGTVLAKPSEWRPQFDKWLQSQTTPESRALPILVNLNTPLLQFPLSYDKPLFVKNFGRLLKFRSDTGRIAAAVLFELSRTFHLDLKPDQGINTRTFMGAHLRTDPDATAAGWTSYQVQARSYINQALSSNLSTIYLSSGNPDDLSRFRHEASLYSINVTTKAELLSGSDLEELKSLAWDQQALVDYEVLLKSSTFGGIMESSFAWNVALRRNILSPNKDYLRGLGDRVFQDGLSRLYGPLKHMALFSHSMWP